MIRFCRLVIIFTLFFLQACQSMSASNEPDFTGVWVAYASEPAPIATGAQSLTPAGQQLRDTYLARYPNWVEPGAWCVPPGMPDTMTSMVSYPVEILHTKDRVTMLAELEMQVRRVFTDGRSHPNDYPPTRMGHSVGHWEGSSLVIETSLLKETLDGRWPRTEQTEVHERVYMTSYEEAGKQSSGFVASIAQPINNDVIVFEITVTDPVLYPEPQKVSIYYQRMSDDIFLEYDCAVDKWQEALDAANP